MNLIEKLLQVDKEKRTEEQTKTYNSKNMERLVGDGAITLKKVKERKVKERLALTIDKKGNTDMNKVHDASLLLVMDGVKVPDLRDERLLQHFGMSTPKDLAELLFDGEISEIADQISDFYGDEEDGTTEEDIKN